MGTEYCKTIIWEIEPCGLDRWSLPVLISTSGAEIQANPPHPASKSYVIKKLKNTRIKNKNIHIYNDKVK